MEREGAAGPLHRRLMAALARAADAQDHSRALVDATRASHEHLQETLRSLRARREDSPPPRQRP